MLYPSEEAWPAIHCPTERTKLLLSPLTPTLSQREKDGFSQGEREASPFTPHPSPFSPPVRILAKFAGLGDCGREKLERARALAEAGFGPPILGLAHGFLLQEFVEGRPLERSDLTASLIKRMAEYYGFIHRQFGMTPKRCFDQLAEMLIYNSRQALGTGAEGFAQSFVDAWRPRADDIDELAPVALDGHPFPHGWIETRGSAGQAYLKTDGVDHFSDHTMVGEQSILWDLAGACEEWEMKPAQVGELMGAWQAETGDRASGEYLNLYRAAYLAFRTAALHYAIHSNDEAEIRESLLRSQARVNCRLETILTGKA